MERTWQRGRRGVVVHTIRETLEALMSVDRANAVMNACLERAHPVPDCGEELRWFIATTLWEITYDLVGEGEADAIVAELHRVLASELHDESEFSIPLRLDETPTRIPFHSDTRRPEFVAPVVMLSPDLDARIRLEEVLGASASVVRLPNGRSAIARLSEAPPSERLLVVIDCRHGPVDASELRPSLPAGSQVVLWGSKESHEDASSDIEWLSCDGEASPEDVGALILAMSGAA